MLTFSEPDFLGICAIPFIIFFFFKLVTDYRMLFAYRSFLKRITGSVRQCCATFVQAKKGRLSGRKHRRKSSPAPSPPALSLPPSPPPPNPALRLDSNIEGFEDWNLGHVRDFISCMDRARSEAYHRRHS
jgi:hypothetical protein